MDDIVAELRHAQTADTDPWDNTLYVRAAHAIERLREVGDMLVNCLEWAMQGREMTEDMADTVETWEELRKNSTAATKTASQRQRTAAERYIVDRLRAHLTTGAFEGTHWVGCVDSHPLCALALAIEEIEYLQDSIADYQRTLRAWEDSRSGDIYGIRYHDRETEDDPYLATVMYSVSGSDGPWHDMVTGHPDWCNEVLDALILTAETRSKKR